MDCKNQKNVTSARGAVVYQEGPRGGDEVSVLIFDKDPAKPPAVAIRHHRSGHRAGQLIVWAQYQHEIIEIVRAALRGATSRFAMPIGSGNVIVFEAGEGQLQWHRLDAGSSEKRHAKVLTKGAIEGLERALLIATKGKTP